MTCLVCLNISAMLFESNEKAGYDLMHTYSRHNYKHSELVRQEQSILLKLQFKVDCRPELIADRLLL